MNPLKISGFLHRSLKMWSNLYLIHNKRHAQTDLIIITQSFLYFSKNFEVIESLLMRPAGKSKKTSVLWYLQKIIVSWRWERKYGLPGCPVYKCKKFWTVTESTLLLCCHWRNNKFKVYQDVLLENVSTTVYDFRGG